MGPDVKGEGSGVARKLDLRAKGPAVDNAAVVRAQDDGPVGAKRGPVQGDAHLIVGAEVNAFGGGVAKGGGVR